jgi:putative transposase
MPSNFSKIVKKYFGHLPQDDYPVLNTFKFVSIWLNFVLDRSKTSMISLFKRLNLRGELLDISTFSKASKNRATKIFHDLCYHLKKEVIKQSKYQPDELQLFPLNSTIAIYIINNYLFHVIFIYKIKNIIVKIKNLQGMCSNGHRITKLP